MTELLYQTDSYLQAFDAKVVSVLAEERALILDQTAFYPGGGGQPCDFGSLTVGEVAYPVEKVTKQGDQILHFLGGDQQLPSLGSPSRGMVEWARRYKLMRTHTALHVLCGTIFRDYGALVTGGNMEPLKGHLDFEFATMRGELVREIEAAINNEARAGRDVRVNILPRDEAFQIPDLIRTKINLLPEGITHVRTIEIVGLDLQADGGTHVRNTREVGPIRVADYKSKGAINKRIYIELE